MKLPIELSYDFADEVTRLNLKDAREVFKEYLQRYKDPEHGWIAVFETDAAADIKELNKMVKACDRLLSWYGEME